MRNNSNRVDVVVAKGAPTASAEYVAADGLGQIEAIDVAPEGASRIILLAPTKQAGQEYAESLSIEPVAIVTPRSPRASYGLTADEIVEAPDLTPDVVADLMMHAGPSLATSGVE